MVALENSRTKDLHIIYSSSQLSNTEFKAVFRYKLTNDTYQGSSNGNIPVAKRQVLKSNSELFGKRAKAFLFKHKLIPIDYSSYSLIGKSGEEVYAILHNCGFKNVKRLVISIKSGVVRLRNDS